jgi:hypothetical protein
MLQKNIVVDDKEIYIYGLNNGIMILINFMTTFFLSFMMQKTFILLFFLVSFIPLRSYCGGIHCKSRILCYLFSNVIILLLLNIQNLFCNNIIIFLLISFVSFVYLFCTKTTGNQTRYLDNCEITRYTKIKRIILFSIVIIGITLIKINFFIYATTLFSSINLVALLVILEKINTIFMSKTIEV